MHIEVEIIIAHWESFRKMKTEQTEREEKQQQREQKDWRVKIWTAKQLKQYTETTNWKYDT